ncbi:MAG TPA: hypothetical protein VFQ45_17095 [Longimicrobium sp.]|nr:hypothetical protein [Longimicrobium sp.]
MSDVFVPEQVPRRSRGVAGWLLLAQLVPLLSLLPWAFLAMEAAESVQAGSDPAWEAWVVAAPVYAYPLLVLLAMVLAWRAWSRRRNAAAVAWSILPLLVAVPLIAYVAIAP